MQSVVIRSARPADAMSVARVHVRSWQVGYRKLLADDLLDRLRPEERAARYTFGSGDPAQPSTIVAEDEGAICGFATIAPARDQDVPEHGELCALYVDPDWWNRGVGVALVSAARARLAALGFQHAVVWILAGNTRAERFYRIDGWVADGQRRQVTVWNVLVDEIRYRRALDLSLNE